VNRVLAARAGDPDRAVRALADALSAGHSFAESLLREDDDLAALQGTSEFERLVRESSERHAARLAAIEPRMIVLAPAVEAPVPVGLLLALHGNNARAEDASAQWSPAVDRGWLVALPQASEPGLDGGVWNDRDHASAQLAAQLEELRRGHALDQERIVLAGFSRGAEIAIWLALTGTIAARGFIAVAPSPNAVDFYADAIEQGRDRDARGFMLIGADDQSFCERGRALGDSMRARGLACRVDTVPGLGHAFPERFATEHLPAALAFVLGEGEPTS